MARDALLWTLPIILKMFVNDLIIQWAMFRVMHCAILIHMIVNTHQHTSQADSYGKWRLLGKFISKNMCKVIHVI